MINDDMDTRETPATQVGDDSHDLDLVTVARTDGATAEMQATGIKSILDASGIDAMIIGSSTLPNLGFEVRVPKDHQVQAAQAIAEAQSAGPQAAVEAERLTEGIPNPEV
jgi:glycine cleavage system aminomethyltransferase T